MNFAESVKRRDQRCVICRSNKKMQAHHLYSQNRFPELKNRIENGITLCEVHHLEFHRMYGGNCMGLDFLEWLYNRFINQQCGVSRKLLVDLFGNVMKLHRMVMKKRLQQKQVIPNPHIWERIMKPKSIQSDFVQVTTRLNLADYRVIEAYSCARKLNIEQGLRWFIIRGCQEMLK